MSQSEKKGIKLVFIGKDAVGKTSLFTRLTLDQFIDFTDSTIGAAYRNQKITHSNTNQSLTIDFWDTAGQERYLSLAPMYYRGADIILMVFDLTDLSTMDRIEYYFNKFFEGSKKSKKKDKTEPKMGNGVPEHVTCIIIGTKSDLVTNFFVENKEQMIRDRFEKFNKYLYINLKFLFTSSKEGDGIQELTDMIIDLTNQMNDKIKSIKEASDEVNNSNPDQNNNTVKVGEETSIVSLSTCGC